MKVISNELAIAIAHAHREIKAGQDLLADIEKAIASSTIDQKDIRDVFGRRVGNLELGVRSGSDSQRIFQVPFNLAKPVINAHIAAQQAQLEALSLQAVEEMK